MKISVLARLAGAALLVAGLSMPVMAFDTGESDSSSSQSTNVPTLDSARADISAKDWAGAIAKLKLIVADDPGNADAYNLLGYSYRNFGDLKRAQQAYVRALKIDPNHTGALEYQGVLYVKLGEIDKAKANLAKIKSLCGTTCEEYEDLDKAIPR